VSDLAALLKFANNYTLIRALLSPHDRVYILTGAGVSAESGIPTFHEVGKRELGEVEGWRDALGAAPPSPALSIAGASRASPCHVSTPPLIELDRRS
jgi:hypothetical protein